jgi:hypothetical protein
VVEQATRSSISASNPRVLHEAGIICSRYEDGRIKPNPSEKRSSLSGNGHFCHPIKELL